MNIENNLNYNISFIIMIHSRVCPQILWS